MKSPNMPLGGVGQTKRAHCKRITADQAIECRFYNLRNHYISALAQTQTPNATIHPISGHLSRKMLEHYSHVRLEVKRRAGSRLSPRNRGGASRAGAVAS